MSTTGSSHVEENTVKGTEEEWGGFEETESNSQPVTVDTKAIKKPQQTPKSNEREKDKVKQVAQIDIKTREGVGDEALDGGTFEALYDQVEEEADGKYTTLRVMKSCIC